MTNIIKLESVDSTDSNFVPVFLILTDNGDTKYTLYKLKVSKFQLDEFFFKLQNSNNHIENSYDYSYEFIINEIEEGRANPISLEDAMKLYPNSNLLKPFILSEKRDKKIEEILHG